MSCGHTARLSALISLCLYALSYAKPLRTFAGNALKQKGAVGTAPFFCSDLYRAFESLEPQGIAQNKNA